MPRLILPMPEARDDLGAAISGAQLHTFEAGTTTPLAAYKDEALSAPHTNPIIFAADGRPADPVWLADAAYDLDLQDAGGNTLWQVTDDGGENRNAVQHAATFAAARLLPVSLASNGDLLAIGYGATLNDGLGGLFAYDSTSTSADNGLNVLAPSVGAGRWLRVDPVSDDTNPTMSTRAALQTWVGASGINAVVRGVDNSGSTRADADIQALADELGTGGGIISLPRGEYTFSGQVNLTTSHANIRFQGEGDATVIKPSENTIPCFIQNGATNVSLRDMFFDNAANGILQNQVDQSTPDPTAGTESNRVAAYGNQANAALIQVLGDNLDLEGLRVSHFNMGVWFVGDYTNNSNFAGTVRGRNLRFDNVCFGLLIDGAEELQLADLWGDTILESTLSSGANPGHLVYLTDRSGPETEVCNIINVQARNCHDSVLKIRKGKQAVIANFTARDCTRALELGTLRRWSATNCVMELGTGGPVDGGSANEVLARITDCGYGDLSNSIIDVQMANVDSLTGIGAVRAILITSDLDDESWMNVYNRVTGCTVITDHDTVGFAPIQANSQTDVVIDRPYCVNPTTNANTRHWVRFQECTRPVLIEPIVRDLSTTATDVVDFHTDTADGYARLDRSLVNALGVSDTTTLHRIDASATGTRIKYI